MHGFHVILCEMKNLDRFLQAQDSSWAGYANALNEMKTGGKKSHWVWYIFPQIKGLGRSSMAQEYAIEDADEAKAFLNHPVLGARLREITNVILSYPSDANPREFMMSPIDALKLKSSMTLFDFVSPNDIFRQVLDMFFHGSLDHKTLSLINPK